MHSTITSLLTLLWVGSKTTLDLFGTYTVLTVRFEKAAGQPYLKAIGIVREFRLQPSKAEPYIAVQSL